MSINNALGALLLTAAVECLAACILGYRNRLSLLVIMLINGITNPALNYILMLLRLSGLFNVFRQLGGGIVWIMLLEIIVVVVEWRILKYAFKEGSNKLFVLSVVMNTASYITGVIILGPG